MPTPMVKGLLLEVITSGERLSDGRQRSSTDFPPGCHVDVNDLIRDEADKDPSMGEQQSGMGLDSIQAGIIRTDRND